jgi:crotonobetainyl-CoA:carnitine CoA-transferase CaiB-like acyl-CoA transferase
MFETAIGLMAPEAAATRHQVDTASRPKKEAGLGTFVASDGRHVTLGVFTPEQTNRFWSELRKDGMTTEEFHVSMDWPDLWAQSDAMSKVLPEIFARFHTAEGWQAWCLQRHLPCSVVRTLAEACCDPLLTERGYWHRSSENVLLPTVPFHMESGRCVDLCGPPELGQNTEQILDWLKN